MGSPLVKSIEINCSVDHAFVTFIEKLDLWWPKNHRKFENSVLTLEQKVGGIFSERSVSGESAKLGEVVVCEPPHKIIYTWFPGSIVLPTTVDIAFTAKADGTLVQVTHTEGASQLGDAWPQRVVKFNQCWDDILQSINAFIEAEHS